MIAGIFAFVPVEQASTVHTSSGNSAIQEHVTTVTTANGDDVIITCPALSSGCHILEVYVTESAGTAAVITTIDAAIDGVVIAGIINNADTAINAATALLPELGGFALGPGDTFTLQMTDSAARVVVRVIAEVGNGIALTSGVA
jgi:hypothetical protein